MFNVKVFPDFKPNTSDDDKEQQLLSQLVKIRSQIDARYVNVSFYDHEGGNIESSHFLTYPFRWITQYMMNSYSDVDPLFKTDFRTMSVIDWQYLYQDDEAARLMKNFTDHGMGSNGITITENVEDEIYGVLSASFNVPDEKWDVFKNSILETLRFQANSLGEFYNRVFLQNHGPNYNITPRESECLYWVALGKTDDQISELLNIGKWTVNGHLQSAKYKLNTTNRASAVAKALVSGIITIKQAV